MGFAPMEGLAVNSRIALLGCVVMGFLPPPPPAVAASELVDARPTVLLVVGAAGEDEYGKQFVEWAANWRKAAETAKARILTVGLGSSGADPDRVRLQQALQSEPTTGLSEIWLVFMGHGTFDGKEAKFNLRGPDISATDLAGWLGPFQRPVAIVDTSSSSGPFLTKLSAPGRVIITATRSGFEQNYARFGQYLAQAIVDSQADLDKDGQTSLLEAFLFASSRVAEFYRLEGRLETEHALLDDNGDGLGTPPDWFRGIRAVKKARDGATVDGLRAHQFHLVRSAQELQLAPEVRARRDEIEMAIQGLRDEKKSLEEKEYYQKLETLVTELSHLYEKGREPVAFRTIQQSADGSVLLLARDVTIHGSNVRYETLPHKNTIGYWTRQADWVSWDLALAKPGKFSIEVLQACGKNSGGSEYTITVGDQLIRDTVPDTGAFTNFVTRTIGSIELKSPGTYRLAVKPVTKPGPAVMDLRQVLLKPAP
jgi:hypothetical protein